MASTAPTRTLRRRSQRALLGGVASGVADYLGVEVFVIRLALVALALFGWTAVAVYALAWVLLPPDDGRPSMAEQAVTGRSLTAAGRGWLLPAAVAVVAVVLLSSVFHRSTWWALRRGIGVVAWPLGGHGVLIVAALLAAGLWVRSRRR